MATYPLKINCGFVLSCGEWQTRPCCIPARRSHTLGPEAANKTAPSTRGGCSARRKPLPSTTESSLDQRQNHPRLGCAGGRSLPRRGHPPPSPQHQAASHQKCQPGRAEGCCAEKQALFIHTLPGQSYRLAAATARLNDKCPPGRVAGGEHPLLDRANWLQPSSTSPSCSPCGTSLEVLSPCLNRPPTPPRLGFEVVPYQPGPKKERKRLAELGGLSLTVPVQCHRGI